MKKFFLVLMATLALVGCGAESELKSLTKERLKDPESARFGKITVLENVACVTISAKNGFGGYGNTTQFAFEKEKGNWKFFYDMELHHDDCVRIMSRRAKNK